MVEFTTMFILDKVHKDRNVFLVLMIQYLNKSIDFSKSVMLFVIWNWISILIVILINILTHGLYFALTHYPVVIDLVIDIAINTLYIAWEINLVISIRIIILLRKYMHEWINEVVKLSDQHENEERCLKLLEIYQSLLKAYNLYKRIFQVLVSS